MHSSGEVGLRSWGASGQAFVAPGDRRRTVDSLPFTRDPVGVAHAIEYSLNNELLYSVREWIAFSQDLISIVRERSKDNCTLIVARIELLPESEMSECIRRLLPC